MRRLTMIGLAVALAGCSALTSFDYEVGEPDAAVGMDAGEAPDAGTDAGTDAGAGMDAGADAGADAGTDAGTDAGGLLDACPAPCVADLDADYAPGVQGAGAAMWRLVGDPRDRLGVDYPDLPWNSSAEAFVMGGASIGRCAEAGCPVGALLVAAPSSAGADPSPTIEMTATATGTYLVGVPHQSLGGGAAEVLVSRSNRADALLVADVADGAGPALLSREVFLAAGDRLRVTVRAGDPTAAPRIALNVWVSGPTATDRCLTSIDFDTWPAPTVQHGIFEVELNDSPAAPLMMTASVAAAFGSAARISAADDAWIRIVNSEEMDLSGDFTIQLWARREVLGTGQYEAIFANPGFDAPVGLDGGASLFIDDTDTPTALELDLDRRDGDGTVYRAIAFDPGTDWHFYRLVREGSLVYLCVDGARLSMAPAPGDYTSTNTMRLGRFATNGVFFTGGVDAMRIFTEALPCEAAP